jgi:hypothetical protein
VFVRYSTPDHRQRVMSPRVDDDVARGARKGIGDDPFFSECIMLFPADAKSGTIRIEMGMDGIETLVDTKSPNQSADFAALETGQNIKFHPDIDEGSYAVSVDLPTDLLCNDVVRAVAVVGGKNVIQVVQTTHELVSPNVTRLYYVMNAKANDVQRFRLEAFRPREYAKFSNISLDPDEPTVPVATGLKGDRWPKGIKAR